MSYLKPLQLNSFAVQAYVKIGMARFDFEFFEKNKPTLLNMRQYIRIRNLLRSLKVDDRRTK